MPASYLIKEQWWWFWWWWGGNTIMAIDMMGNGVRTPLI